MKLNVHRCYRCLLSFPVQIRPKMNDRSGCVSPWRCGRDARERKKGTTPTTHLPIDLIWLIECRNLGLEPEQETRTTMLEMRFPSFGSHLIMALSRLFQLHFSLCSPHPKINELAATTVNSEWNDRRWSGERRTKHKNRQSARNELPLPMKYAQIKRVDCEERWPENETLSTLSLSMLSSSSVKVVGNQFYWLWRHEINLPRLWTRTRAHLPGKSMRVSLLFVLMPPFTYQSRRRSVHFLFSASHFCGRLFLYFLRCKNCKYD